MDSYNPLGNRRLLQCAIWFCLAALPGHVLGQPGVKRGAPVRHGNASWTETYEWTAPAREGGKLILRADMGSVEIVSGSSNQLKGRVVVHVYTGSEEKARRLFDAYHLSTRSLEGGGIYVTGEFSGSRHHDPSVGAEFDIKLPARFNLDVETRGGDIGLQGPVQGEARLTTAGGDIHASDISGPSKVETAVGGISLGNLGARAEVRTAGGSIHIGNIRGDATIETGGGDIQVGQVDGSLRAATPGGDVDIAGASGQVVAQTAGGQIQVGPTGGSVRAETAAGSIRLRGPRGRVVAETAGGSIDLLQLVAGVRASTSAGRILAEFDASAKSFAASQLETSVGDVYVYLPVGLSLTIDAAAGHRIVTDFPLNILRDKEDFSARTIRGHGTLNGGGEVLRIRTVTGNIEIRKLDSRGLEDFKSRTDTSLSRRQERQAERARQLEQELRKRQREKEEAHDQQ